MSRDGEGRCTGPLGLNSPLGFGDEAGRCGAKVSVLVASAIGSLAHWKGSVAAMAVSVIEAYRDNRDILLLVMTGFRGVQRLANEAVFDVIFAKCGLSCGFKEEHSRRRSHMSSVRPRFRTVCEEGRFKVSIPAATTASGSVRKGASSVKVCRRQTCQILATHCAVFGRTS